ncbi:MAG: response regulator [Lachnospiraceae bacterium]|nr:response regulator [Lachnospiraceae bacterium]MCR5024930.1 response regulator [Lachnospiraceae bacterium]
MFWDTDDGLGFDEQSLDEQLNMLVPVRKSVLVISKGSTFMVDAVCSNLKAAGFTVTTSPPNIKELKLHVDETDMYLFYLGDYLDSVTDTLVYLKDLIIEHEKSLNVIGDDAELSMLGRVISEEHWDNVFPRPLDIKHMVEVMNNAAEKNTDDFKKKNILLVDDDPAFLKMVKEWLSSKYKVTIVSSGMQAITYIAKNTPDLILLDYEMPVTTGPQVLEMIRSEMSTSNIPVIFLTGKGDKQSITKVLRLKPDGYILKTAGREKLLEQISHYFETRKGMMK